MVLVPYGTDKAILKDIVSVPPLPLIPLIPLGGKRVDGQCHWTDKKQCHCMQLKFSILKKGGSIRNGQRTKTLSWWSDTLVFLHCIKYWLLLEIELILCFFFSPKSSPILTAKPLHFVFSVYLHLITIFDGKKCTDSN